MVNRFKKKETAKLKKENPALSILGQGFAVVFHLRLRVWMFLFFCWQLNLRFLFRWAEENDFFADGLHQRGL